MAFPNFLQFNTNTPLFSAAIKVLKILQDNDYTAFFVGGCIRDMYLNRPITEIDIVTSAQPQEIIDLFPINKSVGAHFGVILVTMDKFTFDVATFRSDGIYKDGRHPESVQFSSPENDAFRRDFTINGLFYDPINKKTIDYIDGVKDLELKIIRTIGSASARFSEDKLRVLRAIRFFKQLAPYNFKLDTEILEFIQNNANLLKEVSKERIREEFVKILDKNFTYPSLELLFTSKICTFITPIDNLSQTSLELLSYLRNTELPFVFFYLALNIIYFQNQCFISINEVPILLSKEEIFIVEKTLEWIQNITNWAILTLADKKRAFRGDYTKEILCFVECYSKVFLCEEMVKKILQDYRNVKENLYPPKFITGDTLKKLGLVPSPTFRVILEEIETAQLNEQVTKQEQANFLLQNLLLKYKE